MYILGISGSPRGAQSASRRLLERALDGAKESGAEVELIDIGKLKLSFCIACENCHINGRCPLRDDIESIREQLRSADGIIFASPNYFNSVTAQLKTVFDRLSHEIHCQLFLGKYACSVATAGSPEYEVTLDFMNDILSRLGCTVIGGTGCAPAFPGAMDKAEEESLALGRDLATAISEKRVIPEQEAIHETMHNRFKQLMTFSKDHWPYEYEYWQKQGWL